MSARKSLAIVGGSLRHPRILESFGILLNDFDIHVFTFEKYYRKFDSLSRLKIHVFPEDQGKDSYFPGLDEKLMPFDLICAVEIYPISSFQALRHAQNHGKPFLSISSSLDLNYFEQFANIRVIRDEVIAHSDLHLSLTRQSALEIESLTTKKASILPYIPDANRFAARADAREKFRKYLKFLPSDLVLILDMESSSISGVDDVFRGIKELTSAASSAKREVKVIILDQKQEAQDLKYLAYDLGIGNRIHFIHQDPDLFWTDLLNAGDLFLLPNGVSRNIHAASFVLEAVQCQMIPLVTPENIQFKDLADFSVILGSKGKESWFKALYPFMHNPPWLDSKRIEVQSAFEAWRTSSLSLAQSLVKRLKALTADNYGKPALSVKIEHELQHCSDLINQNQANQAVIAILNRYCDKRLLHKGIVSKAYLLRGDAHVQVGDYLTAIQDYESSLGQDPENFRAYRGLGYISLKTFSHEEALAFFKRALAIQQNDPETMLGIGLVYRRISLIEDAIFWFEKACLFEGHKAKAIQSIVQSLNESTSLAFIRSTYERLAKSYENDVNFQIGYGKFLINQGEVEVGEKLLNIALPNL